MDRVLSARALMGISLAFHIISARHDLALTTDQIHMNSMGARFIVEEVEKFLLAGGAAS